MAANPSTVRPVTELGERTSTLVDEVAATGRPVVLTRDGASVAVILSMEQFRELQAEHDRALGAAVAEAEADVAAGRTRSHDEVATRLRRWAGRGG